MASTSSSAGASLAEAEAVTASSVRSARLELEGACAGCPERGLPLRRHLLCRCPVALACRLLLRAEGQGADPSLLTAAETASVTFQERALRAPPAGADATAVRRALDLPVLQQHQGAAGDMPPAHGGSLGGAGACLICRASALARRALDPAR